MNLRDACASLVVAGVIALSSCVPWTVRPLPGEAQGDDSAGAASSSPASYVDSIWASRLIPVILKSAVDARTLLDEMAASPDAAGRKYGREKGSGSWYLVVKGKGPVVVVGSDSRAGFIGVDIAPLDGRADVSIQTGPVLRGTSLRDATGIVQFTNFANQLQYADVGNALNDRVLKTVLTSASGATLKGRVVSFVGTFIAEGPGQPPIHDVVPVQFAVEDAHQ